MKNHCLFSVIAIIVFSCFLFPLRGALKKNRIPPIGFSQPADNTPSFFSKNYTIHTIYIEGLHFIPQQAVIARIPLRHGSDFDAKLVKQMTHNIYRLGYFSEVSVHYACYDETSVDLSITVKEKYKVDEIVITGNDNISRDTFNKKLFIDKILWIDEREAQTLVKKIKKLYGEKQYHKAEVVVKIEPKESGGARVLIAINEGAYARVQQVRFKGNHKVSRHSLKECIASKEYWLLGFFDGSGVFRKEMLDYDRFQIENYYQNNGYFEGKVIEVTTQEDSPGIIAITYTVHEGLPYTFGAITCSEQQLITPYELKKLINIQQGEWYSREKIKNAIMAIKNKLGEQGYMYAEVSPRMNVDKKNRVISIEFVIEKGKVVYVREINIMGNTITSDNVIRRELSFGEGELLTSKKLAESKRAIESLGYFDQRAGVQWTIRAYDSLQSIIELFLIEAKTGRFFLNIGVNSGNAGAGGMAEVAPEIHWYDTFLTVSKIGVTIQKSNFLGQGIKYYLDGSYSNVDKSLSCGASTQWIADWPVSVGWNITYRTIKYEDFRLATSIPNEQDRGGNIQWGFRAYQLKKILFGWTIGIDNIAYTDAIVPRIQFPDNISYQIAFSEIVKRSFQPGAITWTSFSISDDKRNNPMRPTEGYQWIIDTKIAVPSTWMTNSEGNFGYVRSGIDAKWYTPLINEYNIILYFHGYAGILWQMPDCNIPYRELFHVGGPQSVRGYTFGQIGPTLLGSSLGASKSFFVNAELQCPINKAGTISGIFFYDGGAGWDTLFNIATTPAKDELNFTNIFTYTPPEMLIQNNSFCYRHAVGVGFTMTAPMPLQVYWGFKLDPREGEPLYEVHIQMQGSY